MFSDATSQKNISLWVKPDKTFQNFLNTCQHWIFKIPLNEVSFLISLGNEIFALQRPVIFWTEGHIVPWSHLPALGMDFLPKTYHQSEIEWLQQHIWRLFLSLKNPYKTLESLDGFPAKKVSSIWDRITPTTCLSSPPQLSSDRNSSHTILSKRSFSKNQKYFDSLEIKRIFVLFYWQVTKFVLLMVNTILS